MKSYDCSPTLTDSQVLEFCKCGYLKLESVVPEEVNARTREFRQNRPGVEIHEILREPWFVAGVLQNGAAAGALRSLLGSNFLLPHLMFTHRSTAPFEAQGWHRDGYAQHGIPLNYLQVFYYPQDTPPELGPTEFLPGSHFLYAPSRNMGHYDRIAGSFVSAAPAGSIWITAYTLWHRRPKASGTGMRDMLKYNYFRQSAPRRDWLHEPNFDAKTADYSSPFWPTFREQFREAYDAAEMFAWLSGRHADYKVIGGQAWPLPATYPGEDRAAYPFEGENEAAAGSSHSNGRAASLPVSSST